MKNVVNIAVSVVLSAIAMALEFAFMLGDDASASDIEPSPVIIFVLQTVFMFMFVLAIRTGGIKDSDTQKISISKIIAVILFVLYFVGIAASARILYAVEGISIILFVANLLMGVKRDQDQAGKAEKKKHSNMPSLAFLSIALLVILLTNVGYWTEWS